ncbi:MAG: M48 family metalloprotease [Desulfovibrionales bacterium]
MTIILLLAGMSGLLMIVGLILGGPAGAVLALCVAWGILLASPMLLRGRHFPRAYGRVVHPVEAPRLAAILSELTDRAELPKRPQIVLARSGQVNAFALRNPDSPAVGLTRDLLRSLNFREMAAVLAHEISHLRLWDMRLLNLSQVLESSVTTFSLVGAAVFVLHLPFLDITGIDEILPALAFLLTAPFAAGALHLAVQRQCEYRADFAAVRLCGDPAGLVSALQKMETVRYDFLRFFLSRLARRPSTMLRTHPLTQKRIERLLALGSRNELNA